MEFKTGDYIAYKDKQITIIWGSLDNLYICDTSTGAELECVEIPELEFIADAQAIAYDLADQYYIDHPQKELAL